MPTVQQEIWFGAIPRGGCRRGKEWEARSFLSDTHATHAGRLAPGFATAFRVVPLFTIARSLNMLSNTRSIRLSSACLLAFQLLLSVGCNHEGPTQVGTPRGNTQDVNRKQKLEIDAAKAKAKEGMAKDMTG
jgi:hypothetical protein